MTATTALTAQNTTGVFDVHHVPADFLRKQIDACIGDIGVDVVKTGMLASVGTVEAVAAALEAHNVKTLVIDPVSFPRGERAFCELASHLTMVALRLWSQPVAHGFFRPRRSMHYARDCCRWRLS